MGFFIILSLIFYSLVTSLWVLYDFNYRQQLDNQVAVKGGSSTLTIEIHNDKPFIFPFIKVSYLTPESAIDNLEKEWTVSVLPFQQAKLNENLSCELRGIYPVGIVKAEVRDLFGLFTFTMKVAEQYYHKQLTLTVMPRVILLSQLPTPQMQFDGFFNRRFSQTDEPASISDLRQYRFSDPLKKTHWKITSKMQEIYVKNYETNSQPEVYVLVETSAFAGERLERLQVEDQIVESATAIAHFLLSKSLSVNIVVYSKSRASIYGREPQDFRQFYSFLASVAFASPFTASDIFEMELTDLSQAGSLMMIIHTLTSSIFNNLCLMKQSSLYPVLILVQPAHNVTLECEKMLTELNERGIPAFLIRTEERLDNVLEVTK